MRIVPYVFIIFSFLISDGAYSETEPIHLEGNFIQEVVTGLGMPTSLAIQGDYVSVPDLYGRLIILDKNNTIISVLGYNSDQKKGISFDIKQESWIEGVFSGTHGSFWDKKGNLYVQDWNISGRIMKLVRVRNN